MRISQFAEEGMKKFGNAKVRKHVRRNSQSEDGFRK